MDEPLAADGAGARPVAPLADRLELRDVHFRYREGVPVLRPGKTKCVSTSPAE